MRAKKRATAAATFAAISMGSAIAFWLVVPAWPNIGDYGYALVMSVAGAVAAVLAIVLLAVPVLTGRWARQQRLLSFLGTLSVASLLVLFMPLGMMLEFGDGFGPVYDVLLAIVGVGTAATLLSLALATATVVAAEPRRHGRLAAG